MKGCTNIRMCDIESSPALTAYQYWRHKVNGATFALRFEGDRVTGFYGPVAGDDFHPDDLPLYPYDVTRDEIRWVEEHPDEFLRTDERGDLHEGHSL